MYDNGPDSYASVISSVRPSYSVAFISVSSLAVLLTSKTLPYGRPLRNTLRQNIFRPETRKRPTPIEGNRALCSRVLVNRDRLSEVLGQLPERAVLVHPALGVVEPVIEVVGDVLDRVTGALAV